MDNLILYSTELNKTRIGSTHDGGYVTVNLPGGYDLFISGGIAGNIQFEEHFLKLNPDILCYAFDGTIKSLPKCRTDKINFIKKNLGDHNSDNLTTLCEYMDGFNNLFMKIDIEGHEFRVMPKIIENNYMKKIKQLVIEIHSPADIHLYPNYFKGLGDVQNNHMFDLVKKINETHTLVHFHANNGCKMTTIDGCKIPHVFELTYVRSDIIPKNVKNTQPLPTKLDSKNAPNKPDYVFDSYPYVNKDS